MRCAQWRVGGCGTFLEWFELQAAVACALWEHQQRQALVHYDAPALLEHPPDTALLQTPPAFGARKVDSHLTRTAAAAAAHAAHDSR